MRRLRSCSLILIAAGLGLGGAATAQTGSPRFDSVASQPSPDTARPSAGIPGAEAVDPAPGAQGPYVGAGREGFYDVDARIAAISARLTGLRPSQRRAAKSQIAQIRGEEATQRARHGDLRDWDRENINAKLDHLLQQFPALRADAGSPSSAP